MSTHPRIFKSFTWKISRSTSRGFGRRVGSAEFGGCGEWGGVVLTVAPEVSGCVRCRVGACGDVRGGPGGVAVARENGHKHSTVSDVLSQREGVRGVSHPQYPGLSQGGST